MTGTPHGYSLTGKPTMPAACKNPGNIVYVEFVTRALTPAMVDWIMRGVQPPASAYPTLTSGTLADPSSPAAVGFPDLRSTGVDYTGSYNFLNLTNYSVVPPVVDMTRAYQVLVPTADSDGIDLPGVRSPEACCRDPLRPASVLEAQRRGVETLVTIYDARHREVVPSERFITAQFGGRGRKPERARAYHPR